MWYGSCPLRAARDWLVCAAQLSALPAGFLLDLLLASWSGGEKLSLALFWCYLTSHGHAGVLQQGPDASGCKIAAQWPLMTQGYEGSPKLASLKQISTAVWICEFPASSQGQSSWIFCLELLISTKSSGLPLRLKGALQSSGGKSPFILASPEVKIWCYTRFLGSELSLPAPSIAEVKLLLIASLLPCSCSLCAGLLLGETNIWASI